MRLARRFLCSQSARRPMSATPFPPTLVSPRTPKNRELVLCSAILRVIACTKVSNHIGMGLQLWQWESREYGVPSRSLCNRAQISASRRAAFATALEPWEAEFCIQPSRCILTALSADACDSVQHGAWRSNSKVSHNRLSNSRPFDHRPS